MRSADGSTCLRVSVIFTDEYNLVIFAPLWFSDRTMLPAQQPLMVSCPSKHSGSDVALGWQHWPGQNSRQSLASGKASVISMDTGDIDVLNFRIGTTRKMC